MRGFGDVFEEFAGDGAVVECDVGLGDDADCAAVFVDDEDAADFVLFHEFCGELDGVVAGDDEGGCCHGVGDFSLEWVVAFREDAADDVAVGDGADNASGFEGIDDG